MINVKKNARKLFDSLSISVYEDPDEFIDILIDTMTGNKFTCAMCTYSSLNSNNDLICTSDSSHKTGDFVDILDSCENFNFLGINK